MVELTEVPAGLAGRPSGAMAAQQPDDVITKTASDRTHSYMVMSLLTGARTEELRARRWEHVHLEGQLGITPPVPPFVEVWRSVRAGGDTKTMKSRRKIALPDQLSAADTRRPPPALRGEQLPGGSGRQRRPRFRVRVGYECSRVVVASRSRPTTVWALWRWCEIVGGPCATLEPFESELA